MTLITIVHVNIGERAFGINAGDGDLMLTVRGEYDDELQDLLDRISRTAGIEAEKHGLSLDTTYEDSFSSCFNHESAVSKIMSAAGQLDIPIVEMKEPFRASEDFGRFTKEVSGAIFYVGDGVDYAPLHTIEYDFPDKILPIMVDLYKAIIEMNAKNPH